MSEPFLAEIRMVGFNFAPRGWAFCDGQILPINQNQSLFSLLGTTYGGDGETSFALPDLRGRVPIHEGQGTTGGTRSLGQAGGEETHTLSAAEMPAHTHTVQASSAGADQEEPPSGGALARPSDEIYADGDASTSLAAAAVAGVGGGQAHENMQPYLAVNFCIALQGLFPSPN